VRAALRRFPTFHAGLGVSLDSVAVRDHGDLDVGSLSDEDAITETERALRSLALEAELVILLGGDNAITRPAMRALCTLADAGLVTLDAHHDVRGFHAGPTNGTPVRGLIEDGLRGECVAQIGIGVLSNSLAYRGWCADHGVELVGVDAAREQGVGDCVTQALDSLALRCTQIYVDLDVDVVDKAFAPGCPGSRPGGLLPSELLAAAAAAGKHPSVRAIDIVEVDATADPTGATVDLAAMCLLSAAAGLAARI
jgi:arginase family enzyme